MKMKKLGAIAASFAVLGALALTGCGGSGSASTAASGSDAGSASASGSEVKLVKDGTLTVGMSADYEPFEYMEGDDYKGFDVELAQAIGEKLGYKVEFANVDFDSIVAGVASGTKYDVGMSAITVTPERKKEVDFSDSYYMDDQAIVTNKTNTAVTGDNYTDELNKEGVKIAVQSGSTAESFAKENFPKAELVPFKNAVDCFSALQANGSDSADKPVAVVTNRSVAAQMVAQQFSEQQVVKLISTGEEYAIAVSKDNSALKGKIDDALKELTDDGTVDQLMAKYNIK